MFSCEFCEISKKTSSTNTSGWLLLTKFHDFRSWSKMRLPCFKLRWLLNGMNMSWHSVFSFLFFFCLETTLQERNWMKTTSVAVMFFCPESIIPKILDHSYVQSSLSIITRQLDNSIWKIPYNWIFFGHQRQACTKTFNLLLYASFFLKQA